MSQPTAAEYRRHLGMTQQQIADALGMNIRSWQEIESGNTRLKTVHTLALQQILLSQKAPVALSTDKGDLLMRLERGAIDRHQKTLEVAKDDEHLAHLMQGQALIMEGLRLLLLKT